jgi:HNH endonuclease
MARLEIEHIIPLAKGRTSDHSNLWLACPLCNRHKTDKTSAVDQQTGSDVPLFNPLMQRWADHFPWSDDGLFLHGLTPTGRATVAALRLSSDPDALVVRGYWIAAGWHPPND